jgi:tRNA-specific 2-thiouridylase
MINSIESDDWRHGIPAGATVAVGMSGGTDSTAVTAMLVEAGIRVFGVTAAMTTEFSRCCSDEDTSRACHICKKLGIAHHVIDVRPAFQASVIDSFMEEYTSGRTPSPCVSCNRHVKFGALLDAAHALGATHIATGHYARVATESLAEGASQRVLRRGVDAGKDQSYFLSRLDQRQLAAAILPLGGMCKPDIVAYVDALDLAPRPSRESQELCFVTSGTHGEWIDLRSFKAGGPGDIVTMDGRVVGRHVGIHHYTVGQRKGLGIALGHPVYVVAIDEKLNRLVVGDRAACAAPVALIGHMRWQGTEPPQLHAADGLRCGVQIRYNHGAAPATVRLRTDGDGTDAGTRLRVTFDDPQFAVAPGQLAVCYADDRVLGAGWIAASEGGVCGI